MMGTDREGTSYNKINNDIWAGEQQFMGVILRVVQQTGLVIGIMVCVTGGTIGLIGLAGWFCESYRVFFDACLPQVKKIAAWLRRR